MSRPGRAVFIPSAGTASATSSPPETSAAATGGAAPGRAPRPEPRLAVPGLEAAEERDAALLDPVAELESTAGSTVSEPITATATTRIVPVANEVNVASPAMYMPAMAIITVKPEIRTARPDVAAAATSDACSLVPAARSSRSRRR